MEQKSRANGKWSSNWERPFLIENMFSGNAYDLVEVESGLMIHAINDKYLKAHNKPKDRVQIGIRL